MATEVALALTPAAAPIIALVTDSVRSPHTKRAYQSAVTGFLLWCQAASVAAFSKAAVQQYRSLLEARHLSAASIQVQIRALELSLRVSDMESANLNVAPVNTVHAGRLQRHFRSPRQRLG